MGEVRRTSMMNMVKELLALVRKLKDH